jgi:hypothetical protein
MKRAVIAIVILVATAFAVAAAQSGGGATSSPASTPAGPVPRAADGHPDLSGVWWPGNDLTVRPLAPSPAPASAPAAPAAAPRPRPSFASLYQPWAMEKAKTLSDKDDPSLHCISAAFGTLNVSLYGMGVVGQIVQTPKFLVMLTETYHGFRLVPTDGRKLRDAVSHSLRGDSFEMWDCVTLVVDTTNFTDTNWMADEGLVSFHSDALHIVERYRRVDANTLEVEATVEDPKVLTGPWIVPKQTLRLAPFDQIMEVACTGTATAALMDAASKVNYGKK